MKNKKDNVTKKITPTYGSGIHGIDRKALPIPKTVKRSFKLIESETKDSLEEEMADSCPTPVFELGWRPLHARLELLASRLESQAFVFSKHVLKQNLDKSNRCTALAYEIRQIAGRVLNWPKLSQGALAGEKNWVGIRYSEIITEAGRLVEGNIF